MPESLFGGGQEGESSEWNGGEFESPFWAGVGAFTGSIGDGLMSLAYTPVNLAAGIGQIGLMGVDIIGIVSSGALSLVGVDVRYNSFSSVGIAMEQGQLSAGQVYANTAANVATQGAWDAGKAIYEWSNGEISDGELRDRLNMFAAGTALTAAGLARTSSSANQYTNLINSQRAKHILAGDATGGGHQFGLSRLFNGKSKFPVLWSKEKILHAVSEVATNPNSAWVQQTGKPGSLFTRSGIPVKFKVEGVFDGLRIRAIVQGSEIITGFPIL